MTHRIIAALVVALGLLLWHGQAQAACTTHTYFLDGRMVVCTTCCFSGAGCTTTCT